MKNRVRTSAIALVTLAGLVESLQPVYAMGGGSLGYSQVGASTFPKWKGFERVINHHSQIGNTWVNEYNTYYFNASVTGFNELLQRYAAAELPSRKVYLVPLPFGTKRLTVMKTGQYNGRINYMTSVPRKLRGAWYGRVKVLEDLPAPSLTIYVSKIAEIERLSIPDGLEVIPQANTWQSHTVAILDPQSESRSSLIEKLIKTDACRPEVGQALCGCIRDKDSDVQLAAIRQLRNYLGPTDSILLELEKLHQESTGDLREELQRTIDELRIREVPLEEVEAYLRMTDEIQELCHRQKLRAFAE